MWSRSPTENWRKEWESPSKGSVEEIRQLGYDDVSEIKGVRK